MCGITGIVSFDKPIGRKNLSKMLSQIKYRGPDQRGTYIKPHVSMGIQRLSIIDVITGNQPIENEDGSIAVVFNGEIYNYRELTENLIKKGHIFKTKSDTEVLVHLYEVYGEDMSKYINGMFAFAVWDRKRQLIFISRDPVGIKPLYYFQKGEELIFGSELKTILTDESLKREINIDALRIYSLFGYISSNTSIFKNIHKLPPGSNLIFSKTRKKIVNYYSVDSKNFSDDQNIDKILEEAVISQSIADVPLGVLLSGGIDSSLISYYLTQKLGKSIKSFSIGFEEKSFDESSYARIVAKILKTDHYQENFSSKDVYRLFPTMIEKMDEPLADPSLFPTFKLSALARKHVKVVLSGDGGDELFGGYPTYQGHLLAEKLNKFFPKSLVDAGLWLVDLSGSSFDNYPFAETTKRFLGGINKEGMQRHLEWMSLYGLENLLSKEFSRSQIFNDKLFENFEKKIAKITKKTPTKYQLLDFYTYLTDDLLVKIDRASMFNSLEVRVPFLDLKVIQYAFNLQHNHVSLFETKRILRELLKKHLPSSIVDRKKKGFGIPLSKWIYADLKNLVNEHLENEDLYNYFDKDKVKTLRDDHMKKRRNNSKVLWMLTIFSGWLNKWYGN
ncbi:MAG: asparagine synthase (glutamine-hydrolyzing) [Candidatus Daviesbacteria bacterium]|nr:asparagine synthase (glutamine-hydrolyzing) [Candidatus Daviesbacteria bacterium]